MFAGGKVVKNVFMCFSLGKSKFIPREKWHTEAEGYHMFADIF